MSCSCGISLVTEGEGGGKWQGDGVRLKKLDGELPPTNLSICFCCFVSQPHLKTPHQQPLLRHNTIISGHTGGLQTHILLPQRLYPSAGLSPLSQFRELESPSLCRLHQHFWLISVSSRRWLDISTAWCTPLLLLRYKEVLRVPCLQISQGVH